MIPQETIQQILSRIDIVEIVGGFVKLKKRGTNYLGLCPFHNEKTPSFTVSPTKEIYKCFGCGRSGNSIGFIMEHEKYSYVEALKWLAAKYNVEIEETEQTDEEKIYRQTAESLHIINNFAQKFFSEVLWESPEGQSIALPYLRQRGFREEVLKKFQVGYCADSRDNFAKAALTNQYNPDLLIKTGLIASRNEQLVDNYRDRIIFPIHNQTGKIIGFGARIIKSNDRAPKYINTPENEIYVKSKILYGMYFARQEIDRQNECLLVEGYTDVVSLHQAGISNVVASGGTSLTPDQLRLVHKYSPNLTIIYDGDSAGIKAALRGLDLALEEGLNVKLVLIPDKEDPDSYVNKVGPEAFRAFVQENKKDFILFQLEVALKDVGDDSAKKAGVVNQVAETIARISKPEDFTKRQDYIRQCAALLRIEEQGLISLVNKHIRTRVTKQENRAQAQMPPLPPPDDSGFYDEGQPPPPDDIPYDEESFNLLFKDELQERAVIRDLLEFGLREWDKESRVADYIFAEGVDDESFDNKHLLRLLMVYKTWYESGLEPTVKNFLYHEDKELSALAVSLLDFPYELSENWKIRYERNIPNRDELYREEVFSSVNYLKLRKIRRMIDENQKDLERPHTSEEQLVLLQTHSHLKQLEQTLTKQAGTVILK